ncbi:hypothetical protein JCM10450v2_008234 [Rhodotorula kratochvilovae]
MAPLPEALYLRFGSHTYLAPRSPRYSDMLDEARRLFRLDESFEIAFERRFDGVGNVRLTEDVWALDGAAARSWSAPSLYTIYVVDEKRDEEDSDEDEELAGLAWGDCAASAFAESETTASTLSGPSTPEAYGDAMQYSLPLDTVALADKQRDSCMQVSTIVDFGRCFTLHARLSTGRNVAIPVHPLCRIRELKALLEASHALPMAKQNLVFAGEVLEDGARAGDYQLGAHSVVHVVMRESEEVYA